MTSRVLLARGLKMGKDAGAKGSLLLGGPGVKPFSGFHAEVAGCDKPFEVW